MHEQNRESVVNERILTKIKENMKKNGIKKKRDEMNEIKLQQQKMIKQRKKRNKG